MRRLSDKNLARLKERLHMPEVVGACVQRGGHLIELELEPGGTWIILYNPADGTLDNGSLERAVDAAFVREKQIRWARLLAERDARMGTPT